MTTSEMKVLLPSLPESAKVQYIAGEIIVAGGTIIAGILYDQYGKYQTVVAKRDSAYRAWEEYKRDRTNHSLKEKYENAARERREAEIVCFMCERTKADW